MNPITRQIRKKGYTLTEFLDAIGFSLRWYRTHENEGAPKHEFLKQKVEQLDEKQ